MFGYVMADVKSLSPQEKKRYNAVYCGICRQIRLRASRLSRAALRYDMAFLALLLMSLYEPAEEAGPRACGLHPLHTRPWVDNEFIRYAADMNVALAFYKAEDDRADEGGLAARALCGIFGKEYPAIVERWPRQCAAIEGCIRELGALERGGCSDPDECANCFGRLMAELLVYREDLWAPILRRMGMALGRFVYLADAAEDYRRDRKKGRYNPYLAMGMAEDWARWTEYLTLDMAGCTAEFEKLPLVQDKALLDNILYSGVWCGLAHRKKQEDGT